MTLDLETLLRVPDVESASGYSLATDGRHLAFGWNKSGQWEIYELDFSVIDSTNPHITKISSGPGGKFTPRYSPDGKYLLWACHTNGSESFHIMLHDLATRETRDLTPNISFSIQPILAWSPDSRQIAYLSDEAGNFDLYILDVDSPPPKSGEGPGVGV